MLWKMLKKLIFALELALIPGLTKPTRYSEMIWKVKTKQKNAMEVFTIYKEKVDNNGKKYWLQELARL